MGKKKILVVEDEYVAALGLAEMLELWDYGVCEIASTGEDAISIAERERPDIILIDVGLHGKISGIQAAREINRRLGLPAIIISGYSEERIREQIDLGGPFYYVGKPLDFDRLETLLAAL